MKKKLFLVAAILIAAAKADAASITAMPQANNDEIVDVSITGGIEGGDDDQFYTAIRHIDDKKSVIVNLDSPGGNVVSGLKIGEFTVGPRRFRPTRRAAAQSARRSGLLDVFAWRLRAVSWLSRGL